MISPHGIAAVPPCDRNTMEISIRPDRLSPPQSDHSNWSGGVAGGSSRHQHGPQQLGLGQHRLRLLNHITRFAECELMRVRALLVFRRSDAEPDRFSHRAKREIRRPVPCPSIGPEFQDRAAPLIAFYPHNCPDCVVFPAINLTVTILRPLPASFIYIYGHQHSFNRPGWPNLSGRGMSFKSPTSGSCR